MRRWILIALVTAALLAGCAAFGRAPAGGDVPVAGQASASEGLPVPEPDSLNPHVAPPSPRVVIPPGVTPADMPQDFIARAAEFCGHSAQGGQLTLTSAQRDGSLWAFTFQGDGRAITFSEGPGPARGPKEEASHVQVVGQVILRLDGKTGELYARELSGGGIRPLPAGLEHYRGRIVQGGEQTILRLIRPDGGPDGRELVVWIPGRAVNGGAPALWHLTYGNGRVVDLWGLTSAPDEVVAYRLLMPNPPGEELTQHRLFKGVPLHPGAVSAKGMWQDRGVFVIKQIPWEQVRDWYVEEMPRYGWSPVRGDQVASGGEYRWSFRSEAGVSREILLRPGESGTELTIRFKFTLNS